MHLHQFFINEEQIDNDRIHINGNDYNHITNVLRLLPGDYIIVICNNANKYIAEIETTDNEQVTAKILSKEKCSQTQIKINLYSCLLKGEAWDLVLKKCTELGVNNFHPIISERTIVKLKSEEKEHKIARWEKIIQEAAKQCKRTDMPKIFSIKSFQEAIEFKKEESLNLIFWEDEKNTKLLNFFPLNDKIQNINIFIGPEGGFSENEILLTNKANIKSVSLGPNILRADTANITAVAIILHEINKGQNV